MRVVCPKHLQLLLGFAPMSSYFSPSAAPSPGLGACALVGGLGAPPLFFSVLFPPLFRLVKVALGCRQPFGAEMAVVVLAQDWLVFTLCASNSVEVSTCRSTKTFRS